MGGSTDGGAPGVGAPATISAARAAEVLDRARAVLGLTQRDVAAAIPVHESTVHRWRQGARPSPAVQARLRLLEQLVGALGARHADAAALGLWLHRPNDALSGGTPYDTLLAGELELLLWAANDAGAAERRRPANGANGTEREALIAALRAERAAAEASARWARFFARSTEALVEAVGLDDTLARVSALIVPALADVCQILLVRPHGEDGAPVLECAWAAALDEAVQAVVDAPDATEPIPLVDASPLARVALVGEPALLSDGGGIRDGALGCLRVEVLVRAGIRSLMGVPLTSRGRVLGVLVCGQTGREQRFTAADLESTQEFARVAAISLDKALLLEEAERARGAAVAASRAKSEFLATMSHELRTPLNAILGFAALLGDGIVAPLADAQRTPVGRITASARHLLAMIEDLLDFTRVEAGHAGELRPEPLDAGEIARETAGLVEPASAIQGLSLLVDVADAPLPLVVDRRRLQQILLNLLNNAVRYTEAGSVRLSVRAAAGARVEFTVVDTGVGIAAEHLERIFEPFWQVDQSSTRRVGGSGLGLSITRQLARLIGGELGVRSVPGVGSTFTLLVPVHPAGADPAQ